MCRRCTRSFVAPHDVVAATVARFVTASILVTVFVAGTPAFAEQPPSEDDKPGAIVSAIRVAGNRAIATDRILTSLKTTIGQPVDAAALGADTRKLMQTGFFNSAKMRREQQPDGSVVVLVDVTEGQLLRHVKIDGTTKSEALLAQKSGLVIGEPFDPTTVERARHRLEQYLHSRGLADAKVTVLEGDQAADRGVHLLVAEGEPKNSSFGVAIPLGRRQNPKLITMTFKGGIDEDEVDRSSQKLVDYYHGLGFLRARTTREPIFDQDNQAAGFNIIVDEGLRFVITNLTYAGNLAFSDKELNEALRPKPNMGYEKNALAALTKRLLDAYQAEGFLFPTIRTRQIFLERPGEVELVFEIAEGSRFKAGRIECHLPVVDAERRQLLMQNFPQATGAPLAVQKITDWAMAHSAVLDLTDGTGPKFHAQVQPVLLSDQKPTTEQLRFGESIEIELIPAAGTFVDEAPHD